MVTVYAWGKQIERKVGEKVGAAAKELRKWAEGPQKSIEVASWGKHLAIMITVFLHEQADEMPGWNMRGYNVRKTNLTSNLLLAVTKLKKCTGTSTAAWLRQKPDGKAIGLGIVMTGCTKHCGTRARGNMLRLHERVAYWWPDSVQFNGVHLNTLSLRLPIRSTTLCIIFYLLPKTIPNA